MKRLTFIAISGVFITALVAISACGSRAKMETCKVVEIEDAEFEVEFGDVDVEGGEVEMVCGDKIVDVAWNEFRDQLKIDPGKFKNNLEAFKRQFTCMRDERSNKKEVFCNAPGSSDEFVVLNFSYDD
ncbi:MAG: hypothetical protein F6K58_03155 [Symploca sp. SIO2E9]|nr:hypothetical protein [Symploca sp. SIO2E9]